MRAISIALNGQEGGPIRRQRKYFGTDGIRGQVGITPIMPDFIMKLGWAVGRVLAKDTPGAVLIGKDTRTSGYMFESALEAGLSAAGANICLLGPMPTPGVAYLTQATRAAAGIVISASHNSFHDNGLKFFSNDGGKLPEDAEIAIEAALDMPLEVSAPERLGRAKRMVDATRRYIEFCKFRIKSYLDLRGFRIVVDCAHGASYHIAPFVFTELGADVIVIGNRPNGVNINVGHGATAPENLQQTVIDNGADIGVALDGDGDRVILVDHTGAPVDGDEILFIISEAHRKKLGGGVVGTVMSNLGLEQAIKGMGLDFFRAPVGDRYVTERLHRDHLKLGGETSGHIVNLNMTTTGDGIMAALQVLDIMADSGKSLAMLKKGMEKYPQALINVRVDDTADMSTIAPLQEAIKAAESSLGEHGRVLLRHSGTEPLVRVMVEGETVSEINAIAEQLADEVRARVANPISNLTQ